MKLNFIRADNGYLGFKDYKVPRQNLLQRYITVNRDGSFTQASNNAIKFGYGSMLYLRVYLAMTFSFTAIMSSSYAYHIVKDNITKD